MQFPILIEPVGNNGWRATASTPLDAVVEAPTREEALAKIKEQLEARLRNGAEIVSLDLAPPEHPWKKYAGMFKDDPNFKEVLEIMAENRRKMDRPRKKKARRK